MNRMSFLLKVMKFGSRKNRALLFTRRTSESRIDTRTSIHM